MPYLLQPSTFVSLIVHCGVMCPNPIIRLLSSEMTSINLKSIFALICIAMWGCTTKIQMYSGNEQDDSELALVYLSGLSDLKLSQYQAVFEVNTVNGKEFIPPNSIGAAGTTPGTLSFLPGSHSIGISWRRLVEDNSYTLFIPGIDFASARVGAGEFVHSNGLYTFNLNLKAGHTYVIDLASTISDPIEVPSTLCMTEEAHDAEGHWMPLDRAFRIPSPNALTVQCSKLELDFMPKSK